MPGIPGMPGMPGMPVAGVLPPGTPGAPPQHGLFPPGTPSAALNKAALETAPPHMRKQMLGERLFQAISRFEPNLAGKITGMLLEMADGELLKMLENEAILRAKVTEAVKVLNRSVEAAKAKAPAS